MIRAEDTVLILLAAGQSERFGDSDKLAAQFLDKPLALHVVTALEGVRFKARIAVVSGTRINFAARGYEVIDNDAPEAGLGHSASLGVVAARAHNPAAVIIALADMPRVTATHIHRLLDYANGADAVLASSNGEHPSPPALFGAERFDELARLVGDKGARDMIARAHHVIAGFDELVDVDTPDDLQWLRERYGLPTDNGENCSAYS